MNEKHIEQAHLFNKMVVEAFGIHKGTKMVVKFYDGSRGTTIGWINPFYHWFGSDEDGWILPDLIVSINGLGAKDKIAAIREKVYKEEREAEEKYEDALFREKNPF